MAAINVTMTCLAPLRLPEAHGIFERAVIPAATFKGRLRSECEAITAALGLRACGGPHRARMCHSNPCPVCVLFGGPWNPGALGFEAFHTDASPALESRIGAVRGRARGTWLTPHEAQIALLPAGSVFTGAIRYDFQDHALLALTTLGLVAIHAIGGGRSAGFGLCRVEATIRDRNGQIIAPTTLGAALQTFITEQVEPDLSRL